MVTVFVRLPRCVRVVLFGAAGWAGACVVGGAAVVSCVVRGFSNLLFPQPQSDEVTVIYPIYPIIFTPGDPPAAASASGSSSAKPPPAKK